MKNRLLGLEAGRFAAALLVACFHFSLTFQEFRHVSIFDMAFRAGHAGVEYFFVLSGFIIYFIHSDDVGNKNKLKDFAFKRIIRLYPMYLVIFLAMLAGFTMIGSLAGERSLSFGGLILDGLLLPKNGEQVVMQSWSLRHEVVFYMFFAVAILNKRVGIGLIVAWQLASLIVGMMYPESLPRALKPFFYLYNIGFGLGIGAAWLTHRWLPKRPWLIAAVGLVGFFSAMFVEWLIGRNMPVPGLPLGPIASPMIYLSCSALIIFGVTQVERTRELPFASTLKLLGGSSYLLYLVHAAVGSVIIRLFNRPALRNIDGEIVFIIMIIVSIGLAIVGHLLVEKPLIGFLRRKLIGSKGGPLKRESAPQAVA